MESHNISKVELRNLQMEDYDQLARSFKRIYGDEDVFWTKAQIKKATTAAAGAASNKMFIMNMNLPKKIYFTQNNCIKHKTARRAYASRLAGFKKADKSNPVRRDLHMIHKASLEVNRFLIKTIIFELKFVIELTMDYAYNIIRRGC